MFADFLKKLITPDTGPLNAIDSRLALAALLVRVARADGDYAPAEIEQINSVLQTRYGLGPVDSVALLRDAETLESEAPDTVRFTRAIKDAVPYEDRVGVISALWAVVLADGVREAEENALLRLVASLLGVSDVDSAVARQAVEKTL